MELGPVYTRGTTYRARAEARQRSYRADVLGVGCGRYGHLLASDAAAAGANFLLPEAHEAARRRQAAGKGVAQRTFDNMLSSQAMCFNVFAPLASRLELASEVLGGLVPRLASVASIQIEHTPSAEVFGDQSGRGGVDCDVLIEGTSVAGAPMVAVVETKFVEPDFSSCAFRKPSRIRAGKPTCPDDVEVGRDRAACLYQGLKGYRYWRRTDEFGVLDGAALPAAGCPFVGGSWQLWLNTVLAHAEAERRGATEATFAVCVSAANDRLLRGGEALGAFQAVVADPASVGLVDLEVLIDRIRVAAPSGLRGWAEGLQRRYGGI